MNIEQLARKAEADDAVLDALMSEFPKVYAVWLGNYERFAALIVEECAKVCETPYPVCCQRPGSECCGSPEPVLLNGAECADAIRAMIKEGE